MSKVADVDGIKNGLSGRSHCRQRRGIFVGCSASASIPSALLLALGFLLSQKHKAHLLGLEPVGVGRTGAGLPYEGAGHREATQYNVQAGYNRAGPNGNPASGSRVPGDPPWPLWAGARTTDSGGCPARKFKALLTAAAAKP